MIVTQIDARLLERLARSGRAGRGYASRVAEKDFVFPVPVRLSITDTGHARMADDALHRQPRREENDDPSRRSPRV
jgi:hypothetical protein